MTDKSILQLSEIVTIDPKRCLGGVPIARTRRLSVAHHFYNNCRVASAIPGGKYFLTAHDDKLALLEQIRFGERFCPHISWIAETKRLLPRAPEIFSDDLPITVEQDYSRPCVHHNAPAYGAKMWRYVKNIERFKHLLRQGIFFARADRFRDDREGTLALGNASSRRYVYSDNRNMLDGYSRYCAALRDMKRHTYISCWRIDEHENERAWDEYTSPQEKSTVPTRYYHIWKDTPCIFAATVEYLDYEQSWVVENNSVSPFFHKCKSFEWETEFRIIYTKISTGGDGFSQFGLHLTVDE